jgi:hypothetical protein
MNSKLCRVCTHPEIEAINSKIAEGCNLTALAKELAIPYHAVFYHSKNHLPRDIRYQSLEQQYDAIGDMVITKGRLQEMLETAIQKGHSTIALKILAELRQQHELWLRTAQSIQQAKQAELQILQQQNNTYSEQESPEEQQQQFNEAAAILTNNEILLYTLVLEKMMKQTSAIIIPDFPNEYLSSTQIGERAAIRLKSRNNGGLSHNK